jgi:hypothetical protein
MRWKPRVTDETGIGCALLRIQAARDELHRRDDADTDDEPKLSPFFEGVQPVALASIATLMRETSMGRLVINNAMRLNGAFEARSPDEWLILDPDSNKAPSTSFSLPTRCCWGARPTKDRPECGRCSSMTRRWGRSQIGSTACAGDHAGAGRGAAR